MILAVPSFRARHARQHATATLSAAAKPRGKCSPSWQLQGEAASCKCLNALRTLEPSSQAGCRQCSQHWHVFDFANGCMVPLPEDHALLPPLLPEQFAGIGTRSLGAAGAAAIWRLCAASLGAKLP